MEGQSGPGAPGEDKLTRYKAVRRPTAQEKGLIRHNRPTANAATALAVELPAHGVEVIFTPVAGGGSMPSILVVTPLPAILPFFEGGTPLLDANGNPVIRRELREGLLGAVITILVSPSALSEEGRRQVSAAEAEQGAPPLPTLRPQKADA